MPQSLNCWIRRRLPLALFSLFLMAGVTACRTRGSSVIAVIPRTTGSTLWEREERGAEIAAHQYGYRIYWNAPAREDDVETQIELVERADRARVSGLVLAPSQSLALITPVLRAVAHGIPTVIVSSPLPVPTRRNLSYILNDDDVGGRLAAQRLVELTGCAGSIAILGENPDISGIMLRARSLEQYLRKSCHTIRVVKKPGTFNTLHEQQIAEETLAADPSISVVVALMWSSAIGAMNAIHEDDRDRSVKVIGFDPDIPTPFSSPTLDSVVVQDTRTMGEDAVAFIARAQRGDAMPEVVKIVPSLATRENESVPAIQRLLSAPPGPNLWEGSARP